MIRIYCDEDSKRSAVVRALRQAGLNVLTTADAGLDGDPDDEVQLAFAASNGRAVLTANVRDFQVLHKNWMRDGRTHAGIILWIQRAHTPTDIIRGLTRLQAILTEDDLVNTVRWIGDFR